MEPEDIYTELLGVPPGPRPPNHYAILRVPLFEADKKIIHDAVLRQTATLKLWVLDPRRMNRIQDLMNEVARAGFILEDPQYREKYERELAERLGIPPPERAPAAPPETEPEPAPAPRPRPAEAPQGPRFDVSVAKVQGVAQERLAELIAARQGIPYDEAWGMCQRVVVMLCKNALDTEANEWRKALIAAGFEPRIRKHDTAAPPSSPAEPMPSPLPPPEEEPAAAPEAVPPPKPQRRPTRTWADATEHPILAQLGPNPAATVGFILALVGLAAVSTPEPLQTPFLLAIGPGAVACGVAGVRRARAAEGKGRRLGLWAMGLGTFWTFGAIGHLNEAGLHSFASLLALGFGIAAISWGVAQIRGARAMGGKGRVLGVIAVTIGGFLALGAISMLAEPAKPGDSRAPARKATEAKPTTANRPFNAAEAKERQEAAARALWVTVLKEVEIGGGVKLALVLIPAGSFSMGADTGDYNETPVHTVTFAKPFYMGTTAVTQGQWEAVMGNNPSSFNGSKNPVELVSWDDCQDFLAKLSQRTGRRFALPSEAEWEYACRAGSTGDFCFGENDSALPDYAWYRANAGGQAHPVGQKRANAWGLHDMHGNVWEWCQDVYHPDYAGAPADGSAWLVGGGDRVLRGGSFYDLPRLLRSACRNWPDPWVRTGDNGFRVVWRPQE